MFKDRTEVTKCSKKQKGERYKETSKQRIGEIVYQNTEKKRESQREREKEIETK